MSDSTPEGWNPEPGSGPSDGIPERRWFGGARAGGPSAVSATVPRTVGAPTGPGDGSSRRSPHAAPPLADPSPTPAADPDQAGPTPSPARKSRGGLIISLVVALFAAAALTGLVWIGLDSDGPDDIAELPLPGAPGKPAPQGRAFSGPDATLPAGPDGTAGDLVHGWAVPLPAGWTTERHSREIAVYLSTAPYSCADPAGCVRGSFAIDTAAVTGADAAEVARSVMADTAPALFGDLSTHQELPSGPVTVAGLRGFAERWHVVPKDGVKGYVLVVAVPARGGGFTVLTGSVDDHSQAPKPAVLDQIVQGIRTGSGRSV
ncbi:hypothetical protein [Kitasatospora sp. HPMI-4]|uniref:hypothetical protein n=1 Tax=Kitasatospora sp. HPMI-4 TaxID=3448443 RepID=UPI003F1C3F03